MSDDSFIREVNEELRQDQFKALWNRYGTLIIGVAVAVVLATAAYVGYKYWTTNRANQAGDTFAQALDLAAEGKSDEALAQLSELRENGPGTYPVLAQLREATLLADEGKATEAVAAFDAVANNSSAPAALRDMARLRSGLLLIDHGSYADVSARVEQLTSDSNPVRHSAREVLALSAWKEGNRDTALSLFGQIIDDGDAPAGVRQRAEMMSDLISGSGSS